MAFDNPFEIILSIVLILGSLWIIERIIKGAFKTVIFAILIYGILTFFTLHHHAKRKEKKLPKFTTSDFLDYTKFSEKAKVYEDVTIQDIKDTYKSFKQDK